MYGKDTLDRINNGNNANAGKPVFFEEDHKIEMVGLNLPVRPQHNFEVIEEVAVEKYALANPTGLSEYQYRRHAHNLFSVHGSKLGALIKEDIGDQYIVQFVVNGD